MRKISLICVLGMLLSRVTLADGNVDPAVVARGQKKAVTCAACHGANGISVNPLWPNLAGQKKDYLKKQIMDFKAGNRKDPMMSPMAATISDADIDDLVTYFSSL